MILGVTPCRASSHAIVSPVGPAPTTNISVREARESVVIVSLVGRSSIYKGQSIKQV